MKRASIDSVTIATVIRKIEEGDAEH
jgi:hypothetical protein